MRLWSFARWGGCYKPSTAAMRLTVVVFALATPSLAVVRVTKATPAMQARTKTIFFILTPRKRSQPLRDVAPRVVEMGFPK